MLNHQLTCKLCEQNKSPFSFALTRRKRLFLLNLYQPQLLTFRLSLFEKMRHKYFIKEQIVKLKNARLVLFCFSFKSTRNFINKIN